MDSPMGILLDLLFVLGQVYKMLSMMMCPKGENMVYVQGWETNRQFSEMVQSVFPPYYWNKPKKGQRG